MGNKSLLSKGRKHHNTAAQESIKSTWEPVETQTAKSSAKKECSKLDYGRLPCFSLENRLMVVMGGKGNNHIVSYCVDLGKTMAVTDTVNTVNSLCAWHVYG